MEDDTELARRDTAPAPRPTVAFDGRRGELAALLFRNLLLNLTAFGLYRFWGKTRVRQFLWRHVKVLDEPLEYLGTGQELLFGFLIVVIFLAPFTAILSWLGAFLPEGAPYGALLFHAVSYAIFGFLFHLAIYRMWRFRLSRTAWRGVRFGLDGSTLNYAVIGCLYAVAALATLGLAYPAWRVATTRYVANHARFGATRFSFEGGAWLLFVRWWVVAVPALVAILVFVLINMDPLIALMDVLRERQPARSEIIAALRACRFTPLWVLPVSAAMFAWYRVNEFRLLVNGVRIGSTRLESTVHAGSVFGVYLVFWFCILIAGACASVGLFVIVGPIALGDVDPRWLVVLIPFALVFIYWLYGLARTLFVQVSLLALACRTLSIHEPDGLGRAVQSSAAMPRRGEGLADALDVGGF